MNDGTVPMRLLAVSMRRASESSYTEERDAIARDWWPFLRAALPGVCPVLLPNDVGYAADLCRLPGIVGLLLTGGDDVGAKPERDAAERAAFETARSRGLPVLGVCRGLQFLVALHGGRIESGDPSIHRATRHPVEFQGPWLAPAREVNSFHGKISHLPADGILQVTATGPDGNVEGFAHRTDPVYGIHWHPEREAELSAEDVSLFRSIFIEE